METTQPQHTNRQYEEELRGLRAAEGFLRALRGTVHGPGDEAELGPVLSYRWVGWGIPESANL